MIRFNSLLLVAAVAVVVPLVLGLLAAVKVPAVVFEIIGGVIVGPSVLGWVHDDTAVQVVSDLGLGFLLFLAGYEIDLRLLNRQSVEVVARAFVVSAGLAITLAYSLQAAGLVIDGLSRGHNPPVHLARNPGASSQRHRPVRHRLRPPDHDSGLFRRVGALGPALIVLLDQCQNSLALSWGSSACSSCAP